MPHAKVDYSVLLQPSYLQKNPLTRKANLKWQKKKRGMRQKADNFQTDGWLSTALRYWVQRRACLCHDTFLSLKMHHSTQRYAGEANSPRWSRSLTEPERWFCDMCGFFGVRAHCPITMKVNMSRYKIGCCMLTALLSNNISPAN